MKVSTLAFGTLAGTFALAEMLFSAAYGQVPLKVGRAEAVRNEVVSIGEPELIKVNAGDDVLRDETLRTSDDSDARIRLLDDTKLSLGPRSTIKIDRAVYSGETSYKEITVRLTEGAFRFITGKSDKVDQFISLMVPIGLVEVSRTGVAGISRGPEGMKV